MCSYSRYHLIRMLFLQRVKFSIHFHFMFLLKISSTPSLFPNTSMSIIIVLDFEPLHISNFHIFCTLSFSVHFLLGGFQLVFDFRFSQITQKLTNSQILEFFENHVKCNLACRKLLTKYLQYT